MAPGSSSSRNGNSNPSSLQQQQQDQVGLLRACDDRPEEQQQQQVHKSMPSLVRYHTDVPQRLLGVFYMTSDGRASSAQEHMPSGRQSRNEATEQERVKIDPRRIFRYPKTPLLEIHRKFRCCGTACWGPLIFRSIEISSQPVSGSNTTSKTCAGIVQPQQRPPPLVPY